MSSLMSDANLSQALAQLPHSRILIPQHSTVTSCLDIEDRRVVLTSSKLLFVLAATPGLIVRR